MRNRLADDLGAEAGSTTISLSTAGPDFVDVVALDVYRTGFPTYQMLKVLSGLASDVARQRSPAARGHERNGRHGGGKGATTDAP